MMRHYRNLIMSLLDAANKERDPLEPPYTVVEVEKIHQQNVKECLEIAESLDENYEVVGAVTVESEETARKKTSQYTC